MRGLVVGVLAMVLVVGTVVVHTQPPDALGVATARLQLHDNPPRRPVLFPFVLLPATRSGTTIEEGVAFRVLEEERRNDFLREPSTWFHIETLDGTHDGWVNAEMPIEWLPIADDPAAVVRAATAYFDWLTVNQEDPETIREALDAFAAAHEALLEATADQEAEIPENRQ